ncbi:hypothetical protein [Methylomonas sp. MgM2]
MALNHEATQLSDYQRAEILVDTMRTVWDKSKALIENMNELTGILVETTEYYRKGFLPNGKSSSAKSKNVFIDLLQSIDQYSTVISQYHDLLHSDECSYQVPLAFYIRLRHELVAQVILDRRRIANVIDQMPMAETSNFLFKRWRIELIRFTNLDFEPVSTSL